MTGLRRDRFPVLSASGDAWVTHRCECGSELRLGLHKDAKTSPAVDVLVKGGSVSALASVPNAWILPSGPTDSGGSCPGVTLACVDCYACRLESWAHALGRMASANLDALVHLYECGGRRAVVDALVQVVQHSERAQRARGVASPCFRWQSGGDIFADWYAKAIREVVRQTPSVDHWLYTRSLGFVRHLVPCGQNLRVYVSADRYNVRQASRIASRYGLPVSMLADDETEAVALWAVAHSIGALPSPVLCPVVGAYDDGSEVPAHVVGVDGRRSSARVNAPAVGACVACGVCLPGGSNRSVTFTVHGTRGNASTGGHMARAVAVRLRRVAANA
jgi:hypothetical protein